MASFAEKLGLPYSDHGALEFDLRIEPLLDERFFLHTEALFRDVKLLSLGADVLSEHLAGLSDDLETLSEHLAGLSHHVEVLSGDVEVLIWLIETLSQPLFTLKYLIFAKTAPFHPKTTQTYARHTRPQSRRHCA
jgi:hypothetical protein